MTFYVTFGQKYRREEHPLFPECHPDGVLAIEADTYDEARAVCVNWLGVQWCDLMDQEAYDRDGHYYPRGVLGTVSAS